MMILAMVPGGVRIIIVSIIIIIIACAMCKYCFSGTFIIPTPGFTRCCDGLILTFFCCHFTTQKKSSLSINSGKNEPKMCVYFFHTLKCANYNKLLLIIK